MTIWLVITLWLGALVCVVILAGGVRRGESLRERASGQNAGRADADERFAPPLSAARRTPAPTRRATG
jgi:hypothetical protein